MPRGQSKQSKNVSNVHRVCHRPTGQAKMCDKTLLLSCKSVLYKIRLPSESNQYKLNVQVIHLRSNHYYHFMSSQVHTFQTIVQKFRILFSIKFLSLSF